MVSSTLKFDVSDLLIASHSVEVNILELCEGDILLKYRKGCSWHTFIKQNRNPLSVSYQMINFWLVATWLWVRYEEETGGLEIRDRGGSGATSCKQSGFTGIRKERLKETTKDLVRTAVALWNELQRCELHWTDRLFCPGTVFLGRGKSYNIKKIWPSSLRKLSATEKCDTAT
jgi:hypothetical protein